MHYFFSRKISEGFVYFSPEEATHIQKSLRLRANNEIQVLDGNGTIYNCILEITKDRSVRGAIRNIIHKPARKNVLHIAISPVKQLSRLEWFLEKSVELGVESITPIICHRSVKVHIKMSRLEKIAIHALKQSGQFYLPVINPLKKFSDFLSGPDEHSFCYVAHCSDQKLPLLSTLLSTGTPCTVCIGPEGDFTPEEIQMAINNGFSAVSLGNYRLRTETAGIYVCTLVKTVNEK
jgi:16S rRNA (uracil1498-N3)-methyltransferase